MRNYFNKIKNFIYHTNKKVVKTSFNKVEVINNNVNFNKTLGYTNEKKDYYLPLPAYNSNKILSNISGLASIDPLLRLKFQQEHLEYKYFSIFMLKNITRLAYYLFKDPYFPTNKTLFVHNIFKCFSLGYKNEDISSLNKNMFNLIKAKHVPIIQHLLTILCNKFSINTDVFITNFVKNKNIDFSHYPIIHIGLLIEYFILDKNISILNIDPAITMKFINDQNAIILEDSDLFNTTESKASGFQPFCDLLFYKFLVTSNNSIEIIKNYRDIKANFRAIDKNHIILMLFLYTDKKTAYSYMNNFISYLKNKRNICKDISLKIWLDNNIKKLEIIKQNIKNSINYKQFICNFNQKLFDVSFEPEYKILQLNFILAADLDSDIFFPKNNQINLDIFYKRIILIIDTIIPEPMREHLITNLKKFLQITNG